MLIDRKIVRAAARRIRQLENLLVRMHEMAVEDINSGIVRDDSCLWTIEAEIRAALAEEADDE